VNEQGKRYRMKVILNHIDKVLEFVAVTPIEVNVSAQPDSMILMNTEDGGKVIIPLASIAYIHEFEEKP
jgi:hypothetical protein